MTGYSGGDRLFATKLNVPVARMRQTATQTLTNGVYGAVTFTAEDFDSANGHSTSTNTSRYTAQSGWDGVYRLMGGLAFVSNATGNRGCHWRKNGTALAASDLMLPACGGGSATRIPAQSIDVDLAVGDYIELWAFQGSGGNLDTVSNADVASFFDIQFVRRL